MRTKEGYAGFLLHKKYDWHKFVEHLLAMPFAYALLRVLEGQFNTLTFILIFVLMLIYLPAMVVFVERKRYQ